MLINDRFEEQNDVFSIEKDTGSCSTGGAYLHWNNNSRGRMYINRREVEELAQFFGGMVAKEEPKTNDKVIGEMSPYALAVILDRVAAGDNWLRVIEEILDQRLPSREAKAIRLMVEELLKM